MAIQHGTRRLFRGMRQAYNNSSISCGTAKFWAAGYGGVYGVDVTSWSDAGAMPFMYSWLSAGSELYGFFMST